MSLPRDRPDARLKIVHRDEYSIPMRLLRLLIRPFRPVPVKPHHLPDGRSPRLTPPKAASKLCHVRERDAEGIWIYDVTGKHVGGRPRKRVYYFCGGGWQMLPSTRHWSLVVELAKKVPDASISLVAYPLAPKSPAKLSFPRLQMMYASVMRQSAEAGETVVFAGDSSGGNIVLTLVAWALRSPEALAPAGIVAISPSTDLRHLHPDLNKVWDPILSVPFIISTAGAWADKEPAEESGKTATQEAREDWSAWDPRVSPEMADLEPLARRGVKLYGIHGTYDVLSVETAVFRDKCRDQGIEGEWVEWARQMHCFPLAFAVGLKESKQGLAWVIEKMSEI